MRIIYLDIDSLRPDHLGAYGYPRPTSPNLDALAARSVVMGQAFGSSSPCVPSRACTLTGQFAIRHGALTHWGPGGTLRFPGHAHDYDPHRPMLTRLLREHGYETVSFSSFLDRHQAFWFGAGWSQMHTHTLKQGDENADEVNGAVIDWLRANIQDTPDLFLHLQYWDPHRNYTMPTAWLERTGPPHLPSWLTEDEVDRHRGMWGPFTPRHLFPFRTDAASPVPAMPGQITSLDDAAQFINGYDAAVAFLDDQLGQLFAVLDELGVLEETAVVVTADHGEALGEEGVYGDHTSAAEVVHHVPMIVHWPGVEPGRSDALVYQLDMAATVCEMLGIAVPGGWDSRSFASALRQPGGAAGRDRLVWDHGLYSAQRVVRTREWLYRRSYHPGLYAAEDVGLFAVDDRAQLRNMANEQPDVVAELAAHLEDWRTAHLARSGAPDPMDEILGTGGPFRYIQPGPWARYLRETGSSQEADRMERVIAETGLDRVG
ncbi:sulfatase family protein [Ruania alba]|uniref:Arylsulfatase A n=1 Tax=Ruania alba TaxID=648782 RepID=A0A1H5F0I4_9MICO|nr:sulfatase [Ruania alba]SED96688.1 Arylsulfatase A [Ruania alba]